MKRYCLLLALFAQAIPAWAAPPVQGLIWRATSKTATIYLVGSIHFGAKGMYPLPPIYEVAFDQASVVVEEVAGIDNVASFLPSLMKTAYYPPDDSLENHLKPATFERLKTFGRHNGVPESALSRMRPWMILLMIPIVPMLNAGQSGSPGNPPGSLSLNYPGIDEYFAQWARRANKPLLGVETADQQVHMLMQLAPKDLDKSILEALGPENPAKSETRASSASVMSDLVNGWIQGDTSVAEHEIAQEHLPRVILEERNHRMADYCDRYLKSQKTCLFVVGFAHMLGKEGIVQLLRDKGYRVVQIVSENTSH